MTNFARALLVVLLVTMLTACDQGAETAGVEDKQPEVTLHADEIAWFEGTVEAAFAEAKAEGKPLYLYWGAVWCPPCQEIKHTVYKSPQFIAQTRLFVPVYLDGDTERAQSWGEKFGVKGYPTMIIFNPEGEEVTRLPLGVDVSRYNSILAISLEKLRPVSMLVELALNNPAELMASDFQQLAYYSWGQDDKALPEDTDPSLFMTLSELSVEKDPEASARLYMQYLVMQHEANEKIRKADADNQAEGEEQGEAVSDPGEITLVSATPLKKILASPEMIIACWDFVSYWPETISSVDLGDEEMTALKQTWQEAVLAQRQQPVLSTAEQLSGWLPYLNYYFEEREEDEQLPVDVIAKIRTDTDKANKMTRNPFARQSVVNQIRYILQVSRLTEDAKALLLAELDRSASPYYFMSSLSAMAEKEGNIEEALSWRKQAYETAEGAATRFQWGVNYVRAIIRLTPEDHEAISSATLMLLAELDAGETFSGRNFSGIRRLNQTLAKWDEEQRAAAEAESYLSGINQKLAEICGQQALGTTARDNCDSLLTAGHTASGE